LATILNAMFLPAAATHVRRITASYFSVHFRIWYSSVTIRCMGL